MNRFSYIEWGNDNVAVCFDYWFDNRNTKTYVFNPSDNSVKPRMITDRNYQDRYSDPGDFVNKKNQYDRSVLDMSGNRAYLMGDGFTEDGQFGTRLLGGKDAASARYIHMNMLSLNQTDLI